MTLNELKIGDTFHIGKGKTKWEKTTIQGIHNQCSYCKSTDFKKTRNPSGRSRMSKFFSDTRKQEVTRVNENKISNSINSTESADVFTDDGPSDTPF